MKVKRQSAFDHEVELLARRYLEIRNAASVRQIQEGDDMFAFRAELKNDLKRFKKANGKPKVMKIIFSIIQFLARVFVLLDPELLEQKGRK